MARALSDMSAATVSGRWSDFGVRLLSAAVLGPVVLLCVWSGGIAWKLLVELGLLGLGAEWARLAKADRSLAMLLPLALSLSGAVAMVAGYPAALAVMALLTVLIARRFGWFAALGLPYAGLGGARVAVAAPAAASRPARHCVPRSSSSGAPISAPIWSAA